MHAKERHKIINNRILKLLLYAQMVQMQNIPSAKRLLITSLIASDRTKWIRLIAQCSSGTRKN